MSSSRRRPAPGSYEWASYSVGRMRRMLDDWQHGPGQWLDAIDAAERVAEEACRQALAGRRRKVRRLAGQAARLRDTVILHRFALIFRWLVGDLDNGERFLRLAIAAGSRLSFADLGEVLCARGAFEESMPWFRAALQYDDVTDVALQYARALAGVGEIEEARGWAERAVEAGQPGADHLLQILREPGAAEAMAVAQAPFALTGWEVEVWMKRVNTVLVNVRSEFDAVDDVLRVLLRECEDARIAAALPDYPVAARAAVKLYVMVAHNCDDLTEADQLISRGFALGSLAASRVTEPFAALTMDVASSATSLCVIALHLGDRQRLRQYLDVGAALLADAVATRGVHLPVARDCLVELVGGATESDLFTDREPPSAAVVTLLTNLWLVEEAIRGDRPHWSQAQELAEAREQLAAMLTRAAHAAIDTRDHVDDLVTAATNLWRAWRLLDIATVPGKDPRRTEIADAVRALRRDHEHAVRLARSQGADLDDVVS